MRQYLLCVLLLLIGVALGAALAVWLGLALAGDLGRRPVRYVDAMPSLLSSEPWCKLAEGN